MNTTKVITYHGQEIILHQCQICEDCWFRFGVPAWTREEAERMIAHAARELGFSYDEMSELVPGFIADLTDFIGDFTLLVCSESCARESRRRWIANTIEEFRAFSMSATEDRLQQFLTEDR